MAHARACMYARGACPPRQRGGSTGHGELEPRDGARVEVPVRGVQSREREQWWGAVTFPLRHRSAGEAVMPAQAMYQTCMCGVMPQ